MFVSLKPLAERDNIPTQRVIDRLRPKFARIPGIEVCMFPAQDVRVGGRQGRSQYQFTLWSSDLDELLKWVPRAVERVKTVPGVVDVSTDREQGGFQLNVSIDRRPPRASACACRTSTRRSPMPIAQRQVSTIYTPAQPVSRHPRNRPAISSAIRTTSSHIYVPGHGRRAGAAVERRAIRARRSRRW